MFIRSYDGSSIPSNDHRVFVKPFVAIITEPNEDKCNRDAMENDEKLGDITDNLLLGYEVHCEEVDASALKPSA